ALAAAPAFDVRQDASTGLSWDALVDNLVAVMGSAYSVSVFTSWYEPDVRLVWCKSRVEDGVGAPPTLPVELGASPATRAMHPLPDVAAEIGRAPCREGAGCAGLSGRLHAPP